MHITTPFTSRVLHSLLSSARAHDAVEIWFEERHPPHRAHSTTRPQPTLVMERADHLVFMEPAESECTCRARDDQCAYGESLNQMPDWMRWYWLLSSRSLQLDCFSSECYRCRTVFRDRTTPGDSSSLLSGTRMWFKRTLKPPP